ncbi:hypothetical protein ACFY1P_17935 [Streptomyces sp. NPDC001407]|uniref:hypothetical protein n=1 Tax=Streptomyces sp. NPDC001407 TaxID=3364573 RepID=UPI00367E5320
MDDKGESEAKPKKKRLELSLAQVAGSALAAVVAALLAGKLGVYGTVLGAGVVSVVATSGGTIFQHLFRRTGEQLREVTVQAARPTLRQVPLKDAGRAVGRLGPDATPDAARTQLLGQVEATQMLPAADATRSLPTEDATQLLHGAGRTPEHSAHAGAHQGPHAGADSDEQIAGLSDEYTTGTTHGTRLRGWKRPLLAAGAVFVLAMGTVTAVELVSDKSADGEKNSTTISQLVSGGGKSEKKQERTPSESPDPGRSHDGDREPGKGGGDTPSPDAGTPGQGGGADKPSPNPSTSSGTGGTTGGSTPGPKPDPSNPTPTPDGGKGGTDGKGGTTTGGQGTTGTTGQTDPKPPQGQNAAAGTSTVTQGTLS